MQNSYFCEILGEQRWSHWGGRKTRRERQERGRESERRGDRARDGENRIRNGCVTAIKCMCYIKINILLRTRHQINFKCKD